MRCGYRSLWALCCAIALVPACAGRPAAQAERKRPIDFEQVITTAKEKVFPALIFVKPIRENYEEGEREREQVFGSGVIISPDGLAITNQHVIDKAIRINCVLGNKEQVPATLLGQDKETDLALIQLKFEGGPLPFAELGDSDNLTEGQFVMALGSPFGFTRSVSLGIISNTQRYIGFRTMYKYNLWLQTDAAIDPGNSGGPLVDSNGSVIGINTIGIEGAGLAFSIPANEVRKVVERLKRDGKVIRAWTGMDLQALKDFDSNTFINSEDGVLIKGVEDGSPAEQAGIRSGDILWEVNGQPVHGMYVEQIPQIRWDLAGLPVGKPASLTVRRAAETLALEITPVLKGEVEGDDFDCHRWNMTIKGITSHENPTLYFYRKKGVFIRGIRSPGNAAASGLQKHDILLKIGSEPVENVAEVRRIYGSLLADSTREKKVLVTVLRDGIEKLLVLDYRSDYDKED